VDHGVEVAAAVRGVGAVQAQVHGLPALFAQGQAIPAEVEIGVDPGEEHRAPGREHRLDGALGSLPRRGEKLRVGRAGGGVKDVARALRRSRGQGQGLGMQGQPGGVGRKLRHPRRGNIRAQGFAAQLRFGEAVELARGLVGVHADNGEAVQLAQLQKLVHQG